MLVLVELTIRAERWRVLLHPSAPVPLRSAFAYLSIGYFANLLLPARLGDVARAYLAARSFGISTLVTLGTVVVERVSDTAVILLVVLVAGLAVAPSSEVAGWAELVAVVAVIGLAVAVVVGILRPPLRSPGPSVRPAGALRSSPASREGGAALRRPRGAALVLGLTVLPFGVAVCTFGAVSGALGLPLDPVEWALVLGVLALSTAIPAAPGSLGTYEFAGVTVLGILGIGLEPGAGRHGPDPRHGPGSVGLAGPGRHAGPPRPDRRRRGCRGGAGRRFSGGIACVVRPGLPGGGLRRA